MNLNGTYESLSRKFTEAEVTWAGSHPFARGLCFGFDDGTLLFTDEMARSDKAPQKVSNTSESINGLASVGSSCVAVSTRADVTFIEIQSNHDTTRSIFPGGAHGIVATHSGFFVAPLGLNGLLIVKPESGEKQQMTISEGTKGQLYFYRVLPLDDGSANETLVFANRRNGVGISAFSGYETVRNIHTITSPGLDVIDACAITSRSMAVAAITFDGILIILKDIQNNHHPLTIKLGGIEGPVYRILSTRGHLIVLTSKAMYVWLGLIEGLLNGNPIKENVSP